MGAFLITKPVQIIAKKREKYLRILRWLHFSIIFSEIFFLGQPMHF